MNLTWKLEAYDHEGNTIGTITKQAEGPLTLHGTPDAFACCLPDIARLPAFLPDIAQIPDPEALAAQLYEEYARQYGFTIGTGTPATWQELKANARCTRLADRWRAIARTAHRSHLN